MPLRDMLPSSRFTATLGSIATSALVIYGAYVLTHPTPPTPAQITAAPTNTSLDWKQALEDIQARSPLNRLPQAPSQGSVNTLLTAATSDNVTDTVARTLLVNLSSAKAQGLGDDTPTQDQLVADAVAKINQNRSVSAYAASDLTLTTNTTGSIKAYGNAFMTAAGKHPKASYNLTMYTVATSTDNNDPARLAPLSAIGNDYAALAKDLSRVPVPPILAPLHLQVINNFMRMSGAVPEMKALYGDPLRALAGLQLYDALNQETLRLFINIAQEFGQNGILFNKDEPGYAWSALAS